MHHIPEAFTQKYATPNVDGLKPFHFPVDGGGRDLVRNVINEKSLRLMVEIGCFLCGSTRQWLEASPELKVIGIDPWEGQWHLTLERYNGSPSFEPSFAGIEDRKEFIASVKEHGSYKSAMGNIQPYRERFFPLRGKSPEELYKLEKLGVVPDIIYFDSTKVLDDLAIADLLFPNALLCGDDWSWGKVEGFPVQRKVNDYCAAHGYTVTAKNATWIIQRPGE